MWSQGLPQAAVLQALPNHYFSALLGCYSWITVPNTAGLLLALSAPSQPAPNLFATYVLEALAAKGQVLHLPWLWRVLTGCSMLRSGSAWVPIYAILLSPARHICKQGGWRSAIKENHRDSLLSKQARDRDAVETEIIGITESRSHGTVQVGRELQDCLVPTHHPWAGYLPDLKAPSCLVLNTFRDATISLDNLFQDLTTLTIENSFLISNVNLPSSSSNTLSSFYHCIP